jgi:hypothetical protein
LGEELEFEGGEEINTVTRKGTEKTQRGTENIQMIVRGDRIRLQSLEAQQSEQNMRHKRFAKLPSFVVLLYRLQRCYLQ